MTRAEWGEFIQTLSGYWRNAYVTRRTDCKNCIAMGRVSPLKVCPRCKYCLDHAGCCCVACGICRKRVAPPAVCKKCSRCREHHIENIPESRDFPFRRCEYVGAAVAVCSCNRYSDYVDCKKCKRCPRHRCDCTSFVINPLPRTIGCELEIGTWGNFIERDAYNDIPVKFNFERDGSVHPSERELVTGRMIGDRVPLAMGALADALRVANAVPNESCGFHVHVDGADLSAGDLRRILVGFKIFQDDIFKYLVAPERTNNVYCPKLRLDDPALFDLMRLESSGDINNWFYRYLYGLVPNLGEHLSTAQKRIVIRQFDEQIKAKKAHKYENGARRQAINFHSWMMRGTVEFRLKEGTIDKADLVNWPLFCGWFVHKFASFQDKEVLWWMKKGIPLVELAERFTSSSLGGARMPKSVLEWVASRVASPPKPPKKARVAESQPTSGTIDNAASSAVREILRRQREQWETAEESRRLQAQRAQTIPIPNNWNTFNADMSLGGVPQTAQSGQLQGTGIIGSLFNTQQELYIDENGNTRRFER